jgi:hypothetical protein
MGGQIVGGKNLRGSEWTFGQLIPAAYRSFSMLLHDSENYGRRAATPWRSVFLQLSAKWETAVSGRFLQLVGGKHFPATSRNQHHIQ